MTISLTLDQTLELLAQGDMESLGLMPWGSNYSFLVKITPKAQSKRKRNSDEEPIELLGVYKPRKGETPLWDFPDGTLCLRELAAYFVNNSLEWNIVPPTVLRNGEHGVGSVQLYVDNDPNQHFFTFREDPLCEESLKRVAAFDLIINNADRKSGHCLRDTGGKVWAIDHGIAFNADYKLRTVIWDYAGQSLPGDITNDLIRLSSQIKPSEPLGQTLEKLLDESEIRALQRRIDGLLKIKTFPSASRYERSVPWPPV